MNILVVNIGSTSFKFRLFNMADERVLAHGGVEGVGKTTSRITLQIGDAGPTAHEQPITDQAEAIHACLAALGATGTTQAPVQVDAVGFKAVHGGPISGAVRVTPDVMQTMQTFSDVAPAHNPAYLAAMRAFGEQMPQTPLVAAFETGFHQSIPPSRTTYAIPYEWTRDLGVRRYGFHGASHQYVATRVAELFGTGAARIISCHLGGSSSICAIRDGQSIANSFGMTPQSGLPQNNRVGDFDAYALLRLRSRTGLPIEDLLERMAREGGLLGISGVSNDMPEIIAAAEAGHEQAALALEVFVESIRDCIGAYLVALGGLDVLVFTGGIGERSPLVRQRVCEGLSFLGIRLSGERNDAGANEVTVSADVSDVRVLVLQTNEELIVARQTRDVLQG